MKLFDVYPLFDIEIKSGKGCYTYDTEGKNISTSTVVMPSFPSDTRTLII